jgi:hypothetical protein
MRIQGFIDDHTLRYGSYVHKDFIHTDNPVALLMKQIFPGVAVHDTFMGFCNKDGYEVTIHLPGDVSSWLYIWHKTPPADRKKLPNLSFELEIPKKAIDSIGEFSLVRTLRSTRNIKLLDEVEN